MAFIYFDSPKHSYRRISFPLFVSENVEHFLQIRDSAMCSIRNTMTVFGAAVSVLDVVWRVRSDACIQYRLEVAEGKYIVSYV